MAAEKDQELDTLGQKVKEALDKKDERIAQLGVCTSQRPFTLATYHTRAFRCTPLTHRCAGRAFL